MLNDLQDKANERLLNELFGICYSSSKGESGMNEDERSKAEATQRGVFRILQGWNNALSSYSNDIIKQLNQSLEDKTQLIRPNHFNLNLTIDYDDIHINSLEDQAKCMGLVEFMKQREDPGLKEQPISNVDNPSLITQPKNLDKQSRECSKEKATPYPLFQSLSSKDTIATLPKSPQRRQHKLFRTVKSAVKKPQHKVVFLNVKRFIKPSTPHFVKPHFKLSQVQQQINLSQIKLQPEVKVCPIKEITKQRTKRKQKTPRGSKYRGVSRNGNQWQVLIMVNKSKRYVGSYSNEEEAARAYDVVALQNHGAKARTNFDYIEAEVVRILSGPAILKLSPE